MAQDPDALVECWRSGDSHLTSEAWWRARRAPVDAVRASLPCLLGSAIHLPRCPSRRGSTSRPVRSGLSTAPGAIREPRSALGPNVELDPYLAASSSRRGCNPPAAAIDQERLQGGKHPCRRVCADREALSRATSPRGCPAITGAHSVPGLGEQVAVRLAPWRDFAESAVRKAVVGSPVASLLPATQVAHAVVAGLLGLELLANLDGDRTAALALFDRARLIAALLDVTGPAFTTETPTGDQP